MNVTLFVILEMGRAPPPSITLTEGSVTSSDYSAGFNDVLSSLHTHSRELERQEMGVVNKNRTLTLYCIIINYI